VDETKRRKRRKRKKKKKQFLYLSVEVAPLGPTHDIECAQLIEVPLRGDGTARIELDVDVRHIDHIILRPIRREMDDVEGVINDAQKLANRQ